MTNPTERVFQFYDTDGALISAVGRAMCIALDQGAAVVCIATEGHRQQLERHLMVRGIDVAKAQAANQFRYLDAYETLSRVVKNGVPDAVRFVQEVGNLVDDAADKFPRVWIFSELVALMCANGHHEGASRMESIWVSFTESRPRVVQRCAYPTNAFNSAADLRAFLHLCEDHCRALQNGSLLANEAANA